MRFDELTFDRPVLILANGKSLINADVCEVKRLADKMTVIAINGAGKIKPDIRFFMDNPENDAEQKMFICYGKRGEKWAGRSANWPDNKKQYNELIDYEIDIDNKKMAPWNNSFLAALYIVCNISTVPVYVLGGDCNSEYVEEVLWGEDYKTTKGNYDIMQRQKEHYKRVFDSAIAEVGEIERKFPGRIISLCGDYSALKLQKKDIKEV